jgi:hypothetical protein
MAAGFISFQSNEYRMVEGETIKIAIERTGGSVGAVSAIVTNGSSTTLAGRSTRKVDFVAENPIKSSGTKQLVIMGGW